MDCLQVNADWSTKREAFIFAKMVSRKELSIEQAEHDISMSDAQRDWLIKEKVAPAWLVLAIQKRRARTLSAFRSLLARDHHVQRATN